MITVSTIIIIVTVKAVLVSPPLDSPLSLKANIFLSKCSFRNKLICIDRSLSSNVTFILFLDPLLKVSSLLILLLSSRGGVSRSRFGCSMPARVCSVLLVKYQTFSWRRWMDELNCRNLLMLGIQSSFNACGIYATEGICKAQFCSLKLKLHASWFTRLFWRDTRLNHQRDRCSYVPEVWTRHRLYGTVQWLGLLTLLRLLLGTWVQTHSGPHAVSLTKKLHLRCLVLTGPQEMDTREN